MMRLNDKTIPFFLFAVFLFLLAACQSQAEMASSDFAPAAEPMQASRAQSIAGGADDGGFAFAEEEAMEAEMAVDTDQSVANQTVPEQRLIIRSANMDIVVTDTEEALGRLTQMAEENGGWVVNSNVFQYSETAKTGNITIRVPAEGFQSALDAISAMAVEVNGLSTSGQDVTEEFVDLSARLANLEATADRVRAFLDDTETVEEALAVNAELSRLESDIEAFKGRIQFLSQSAAFSTITVNLTPDELAQPIEVGRWQPTGVAREAVEALVNALQGLGTFAIWLVIYVLPVGLLVGVPLWLVVRFIRRRWRGQPTEEPNVEPSG